MEPNRRPAEAAATLGAGDLEHREGGMETEREETWTCERCGAVRPANWTCECGGNGGGRRIVPEGWTPELTRTSRPRLDLVARPQPPEPEE